MYGLNKLDIKAHKITSYKEADGIGGFQFYDRASCKLKDGTLIFGGTHGLTIFNPQNVTTNQPIKLLFENLKVHNNLVQAKEKGNIRGEHGAFSSYPPATRRTALASPFPPSTTVTTSASTISTNWKALTNHGSMLAAIRRPITPTCQLAAIPSR